MKRQLGLGTLVIGMLMITTLTVVGSNARADLDTVRVMESVYAPDDTLVVTSTADSGPGTLRQAMLDADDGDTITFDLGTFPPTGPATIALTTGLPEITQGNLTIDASNAGVVLDGSGIGTTPETVLLDDVSLTLDGGPNLIANSDFSAGMGHWRPWDDRPGATRDLSGSSFHSSPYSYEWSSVAPVVDSLTAYDTTNTSDPFDESFDADSTIWISATGGSTVDVHFWYRYGRIGVFLYALSSDDDEGIGTWWFDWEAGWTQGIVSTTLPTHTIGVALAFDHSHSERWTNGLSIKSDNNAIQGLQIVYFPSTGIELADGAQNSIIGGNRGAGAGPMGQGNLLSGNGDCGVGIGDSGTTSNTVSGNYVGTDVTGMTAIPNGDFGVAIGGGASNNTIGGNNASPGGACSGECNLISGNDLEGVSIRGTSTDYNVISGNYIGVDVSGTTTVPNKWGLAIWNGAQYNIIGGLTSSKRNVISGNTDPHYATGVGISGAGTEHNTVIGNYIGTDSSGMAAVGNGGGPYAGSGITINYEAAYNTIGGDTSEERNLISGNDGAGVQILFSASYNIVSGNYIGTDISGTASLPNTSCGVQVGHGSNHNTIGGNNASPGGACSGECNLVSGNDSVGLAIQDNGTDYNIVSGNHIGTDVSGTGAVSNGDNGVYVLEGAAYNTIGGDTPAERNVISGNKRDGVSINDSDQNTVSGNYIGTDINGTAAIPNDGSGISICCGASGNTIGGDSPGGGNVISRNDGPGVSVDGGDTLFNTITRNAIYGNDDRGIDLSNGGNTELPAPAITSADPASGIASGTACISCTVEIFSDDEDEGRVYEGSVTADASGNWTLSKGSSLIGPHVTATATDTGGNTSEFSIPAGGSRIYLPAVFRNAEPLQAPSAPVLDDISNPDGDGDYTVSWSAVSGATGYTLEEDDNAGFSSPTAVYSGSGTSKSITGKDAGTYYYRVNASNASGSSDWSNVRSVVVTAPAPGPEPGHYVGTPSLSFDVTESQQVCNFDITVPFGIGSCRIRPSCTDITDNNFTFSQAELGAIFTITGTFDSQIHAVGGYSVSMCGDTMVIPPSQGTWAASK